MYVDVPLSSAPLRLLSSTNHVTLLHVPLPPRSRWRLVPTPALPSLLQPEVGVASALHHAALSARVHAVEFGQVELVGAIEKRGVGAVGVASARGRYVHWKQYQCLVKLRSGGESK